LVALTQHIGSHRARDHNYLSEPANHFGLQTLSTRIYHRAPENSQSTNNLKADHLEFNGAQASKLGNVIPEGRHCKASTGLAGWAVRGQLKGAALELFRMYEVFLS
jgi:hypothetical protein